MSGLLHSAVHEVVEQNEIKDLENFVNKESLECSLCNIKVTSMKILERHLEGKKHRIREAKIGKDFICDVCDVRANSAIQLEIHMRSSRHRGNIIKKEYSEFTSMYAGVQGAWLIVICLFIIFLNFFLLFQSKL